MCGGGLEYIIFEFPITEEEKIKITEDFKKSFRHSGFRNTENLHSENQQLLSNEATLPSKEEQQPEEKKAPSAVVVSFKSLDSLELNENLKQKISKAYSEREVDIAVARCIAWKGRSSDSAGIMTTIKKADSWVDNPSKQMKQENNIDYLGTLRHLDGETFDKTQIIVGNKYIQFIAGMKDICYSIDQEDFIHNVKKYLDYLFSL
jgi:hypothetical protein